MRWMDLLQPEVERVIEYVESYKATHGQYPADLAAYSFERNDLRAYIHYAPPSDSRFPTMYEIRYHPTHIEGIAHWYNPGKFQKNREGEAPAEPPLVRNSQRSRTI